MGRWVQSKQVQKIEINHLNNTQFNRMKVKGIIHDRSIQLLENISIAEGTEVTIEITEFSLMDRDTQWKQLQKVIGAWQNVLEIDKIFNDIDEERHKYHGRDIDFENFE
jgi:hypothetical protein